jgi:hypothetical protein
MLLYLSSAAVTYDCEGKDRAIESDCVVCDGCLKL